MAPHSSAKTSGGDSFEEEGFENLFKTIETKNAVRVHNVEERRKAFRDFFESQSQE